MAPAAGIDAVTVDGFGTLLELRAPVDALSRLLPGHDRAAIERGFAAEAEHYVAASHRGRDDASLRELYEECVAIFNEEAGASLAAAAYVGALDGDYRLTDGAADSLRRLGAHGVEMAVVANWDLRLPGHLERLGVAHHFRAIVTSAAAGAPKPDPRPFLLALERLGVPPGRALHIGDSPADEEGARSAGMRFAPAPLATLPERLG